MLRHQRQVARRAAAAWMGWIAAGGVVLSIGLASPAQAIGNGSWSVMPSDPSGEADLSRPYFEYAVDPGAVVEDGVVVKNLTETELTFEVFAADALPTQEGAFAVGDPEDEQTGIGKWVVPELARMTLEPHGSAEVPFRMDIPLNAEPGDHAGGIVVRNVEPDGAMGEEGMQLQVQRAVGVRIYLRIHGEVAPAIDLHGLSIRRASLPVFGRTGATVTYSVTNTGNIRLRPVVKIEAHDVLGKRVRNFHAKELPELLPGQTADGLEVWTGMPWVGRFDLEVTVVAGTIEDRAMGSVWTVPVGLLLVPVAVVVEVGRRLHRRSRHRVRVHTASAAARPRPRRASG